MPNDFVSAGERVSVRRWIPGLTRRRSRVRDQPATNVTKSRSRRSPRFHGEHHIPPGRAHAIAALPELGTAAAGTRSLLLGADYFGTLEDSPGVDHAPAGGRSGNLAPGLRMYQRMNSRSTRARGLRPSGCMARVACSKGSHSSSGARNRRGVSYSFSASGVIPARVGLCSHRLQGEHAILWLQNLVADPLSCGYKRRSFVATKNGDSRGETEMTTTARTATRHIVTVTAVLVASVLAGLAEEFDDCEMCGHASADLYDRLTEDGDQVRACEDCVDRHHLGFVAE